jgi:hypothetical protein
MDKSLLAIRANPAISGGVSSASNVITAKLRH